MFSSLILSSIIFIFLLNNLVLTILEEAEIFIFSIFLFACFSASDIADKILSEANLKSLIIPLVTPLLCCILIQ